MRAIRSRDNATLKRLRRLARDASARAATRRSLIEGEHLARAWLDAGRMPLRAVIAEGIALDPATEACVARLAEADVELLAIAPTWMKDVSGSDSPARLVCEIEVPAGAAIDERRDVVLLDGVQDPGNAGAILRTAAAAGVEQVVAARGTADLWSPKTLRAAMGAHVALAIVEHVDAGDWLHARSLRSAGLVLDGAVDLLGLDLRAPIAWVFGNEGAGLAAKTREAVSQRVRIDQVDAVESLNVAAAAAVCLFEMRRQRRGSPA